MSLFDTLLTAPRSAAGLLVIGAIHVTLFAGVAALMYWLIARRGPAAAAWSCAAALWGVALVTLLSLAPWPDRLTIGVALPEIADAEIAPPLPGQAEAPPLPTGSRRTLADLPPDGPDLLPHGNAAAAATSDTVAVVADQPSSGGWNWALLAWAAVASGVLWMLLRLAVGMRAIGRYRRRAQMIDDPALLRLTDELSSAMRCTTRVRLAVSPDVGSPATIGWRQPLVLLPADWRSWTSDELRAVLAHELAHVARGDYAAWVAALAIRAVHFYHPLVHWLAGRLRLEQELAADSLAMPLAGGRNAYLLTLARMTLDYDRRLAGPARAFLPAPGTLMRRIEMLADDRRNVQTSGVLSRRLRRSTVAVLAGAALVIAALRGSARHEALADPPPAAGANATGKLPLDGLPAEVNIAVAMRPGELYVSQRDFTAMLQMTPLKVVASLELEEAELVCTARLAGPGSLPILALRLLAPEYAVVATKNPQDWQALLEANGAQPRNAATADGRTFFHFGADAEAAAVALSPTQLLVGPALAMEEFATNRAGGPPAAWKDELQAASAQAFAAVIPGRTLAGPALVSRDPYELAIAALAPKCELAVVTSTAEGGQRLALELRYADEASASAALKSSAEPIEALRTTIGGALAQAEAAAQRAAAGRINPNTPQGEFAQANGQFAGLNELLTGYETVQQGNTLRFNSQGSFATLAMLAQAANATLPGRNDAATAAQFAARRQKSMDHAKQIMLGMHAHHDKTAGFPAAAIRLADGKPLLSWRVALLPYLDQEELYQQFRLDEPWDSEHNKKLLDKMPEIFRGPTADATSINTAWVAIVGPHAFLIADKERRMRDILDGMSNTLAIVETKTYIPWTKPEDLDFDPEKPVPKIEGWHGAGDTRGFVTGFGDGSARFISAGVDAELLKKLFTIDGAEPINLP